MKIYRYNFYISKISINFNMSNKLKRNKMKNLFYIGERRNPQLANSYYKAYGQLTKKEALKKENCGYGSMHLTSYNTKEEYIAAKEKLFNDGFRVIE